MKTNIKFISKIVLSAFLFSATISCEDDEPLSAGNGDPLNKNVVTIEATIATDQPDTGEGNILPFSVTLPRTFQSASTVTALVVLDNGNTATGTAVVNAGETTGSGSLEMPADDGFLTANLKEDGVGTLSVSAILLETPEPEVAYVITSNEVPLNIWAQTAEPLGGLNITVDWISAAEFDIDVQIIDEAFTAFFGTGATGSRFETVLHANTNGGPGNYDVYAVVFSGDTSETEIPYVVNFTKPDGTLETVTGTLPRGQALATRVRIARFTKVLDEVTGVISYTDIIPFN